MSYPYSLVLIANTDAISLTKDIITQARDIVCGAVPVALSEGECVDIPCKSWPQDIALEDIRGLFDKYSVDVLWLPNAGRRKKLLVADMDSTLIPGETLDDLAALAGIGEHISAITQRCMNGELDFTTALHERVALLKDKPASLLSETWEGTKLNPGAKTLVATMKRHGAYTALVSGGFSYFTGKVAALCGFDEHHANVLNLTEDQTKIAGSVATPVLDRNSKLQQLQRLCTTLSIQTEDALTVGDGANDLDMLKKAGLGVAFHAKPFVREHISTQLNHTGLRSLLFAQGYTSKDFITP